MQTSLPTNSPWSGERAFQVDQTAIRCFTFWHAETNMPRRARRLPTLCAPLMASRRQKDRPAGPAFDPRLPNSVVQQSHRQRLVPCPGKSWGLLQAASGKQCPVSVPAPIPIHSIVGAAGLHRLFCLVDGIFYPSSCLPDLSNFHKTLEAILEPSRLHHSLCQPILLTLHYLIS
jgi:hypothetical protein